MNCEQLQKSYKCFGLNEASYKFLEEVYDDLASTISWLDARREDLGLEFEIEFFDAVPSSPKTRPESFAMDQTGYRPVRLKRFSAVMYFIVEDEVVLIAGVFMGGRSETKLAEVELRMYDNII